MNMISLVTNLTNTKVVQFDDLDHLAKLVTENDWSHALFKNDYRKGENFYETNIFTLDVDDGCSLKEAKNIFKIINTSLSQPEIIKRGRTTNLHVIDSGLFCFCMNQFRMVIHI
jgi:hypothetical protein